MGKLYFEGEGIIKHNSKIIREYEFQENEELILEFVPFVNDKTNAIPYAITIAIEDGEVITQLELIKVVKWGIDYEITFFPQIIENYVPPIALAQETIYSNHSEISVTVYKDTRTRIIIEAPELFYIHTPDWVIDDAEIKMSQSHNKVVAVITAKTSNKEYLIIMLITDTCRILFEDAADTIIYNKNNITLTKSLEDMRGRKLTQALSFNGAIYQEISKSIEYTYEHKYRQELLPYLLIEAVISKDEEDIKALLDNSLDALAIGEFFGEIIDISPPRYSSHNRPNTLAIIVKDNINYRAILYEFEIKESRIANIIQLD